MISRLALASSFASLLVLLPAPATQADEVVVGVDGSAGDHAPGMPATDQPWRSLTLATVHGTRWAGLDATAVLGGDPPAGETVTVTWTVGTQQADRCVSVARVSETVSAVGPDRTIAVQRPLPPELLTAGPSCLEVALSTAAVPSSDVLQGWVTPLMAPAGAVAAPAGVRLRLVAGRTTPAILVVGSQERATSQVSVTGTARGVTMAPIRVGALAAGQSRPVVARFTARRPRISRLALAARDDWGSTSFDATHLVVVKKLDARRPLPGRYGTPNGSISFRVRADHTVHDLEVADIWCRAGQGAATWPGTFRMPRSGVTAKVASSRGEWFGTQLMTIKPYMVRGTFAFTSPTCTSSSDFVVLHESVLD